MSKTFRERFLAAKIELQVGKGMRNTFASFNYRNKPMILEALKPLEEKYNFIVTTTSELINLDGRIFVKATAIATDVESNETLTSTSHAELQPKAGTKMSEPQLTGSSESYAGKYALGNLFGLDDNEDLDSIDNTGKPTVTAKETIEHQAPKGDSKQETIANMRAEMIRTDISNFTLLAVNDLHERIIAAGGDETSMKMLNTKADTAGFVFNKTTNVWENKK